MSYCMNGNTLLALRQIVEAMNSEGVDFLCELSREERRAFGELFNTCEDFMALSEELQSELEDEDADPGSMDGDHDSAMDSIGWGNGD